jgi:Ca2+/Na+ antiporter
MFSLGLVVLVLVMAVAGMRKAQRNGTWRWSKFFLTLCFMAIVCTIITLPLIFMNMNSRYFWPVYGVAWAVALGLMVWFIIQARRWQLTGNKNNQQPPR